MKIKFLFTLSLSCFFILISCTAQKKAEYSKNTTSIENDWVVEKPENHGLNADSIQQLIDLIRNTPPRDFRTLIVLKNGKPIVNEYFNSFWRTNIHDIRSAGKSVTSMLAGIAINQGLFKPTDKVLSFFPQYTNIAHPSKEKTQITVANLLVMSSGLATDDYQDDSPGREELMISEEDFLKFVLDLPMDFKPGERYAYSSAVAFLLGAIIEDTSGQTLEDFARTHLFGPLGIKNFYWQQSPKGRTTGMGNLYFEARDYAKLGQLMLNKGKWKEQQIIPTTWVEQSLEKRFDISTVDPFAHGYGYMWYIGKMEVQEKSIDYYFASGNGGNKIFVLPKLDMVVVTFSSAYGQGYGHSRSHKILEKVLNAVE